VTAESFAALLRALRLETGLSQNGLARRAGIDPAYINRLERPGQLRRGGQPIRGSLPSRAVLCRVARVLGLDLIATDRLLYAAGLAPSIDWQTRAERAEAQLRVIAVALDELDGRPSLVDDLRTLAKSRPR
jgi:transcriptional regulator with XRE-family HTH domain